MPPQCHFSPPLPLVDWADKQRPRKTNRWTDKIRATHTCPSVFTRQCVLSCSAQHYANTHSHARMDMDTCSGKCCGMLLPQHNTGLHRRHPPTPSTTDIGLNRMSVAGRKQFPHTCIGGSGAAHRHQGFAEGLRRLRRAEPRVQELARTAMP